MTALIVIFSLVIVLAGATAVAHKRYEARNASEAVRDYSLRDLYDRYTRDVEALTQTYLLQAPADEEWIASIRKPILAADGQMGPNVIRHTKDPYGARILPSLRISDIQRPANAAFRIAGGETGPSPENQWQAINVGGTSAVSALGRPKPRLVSRCLPSYRQALVGGLATVLVAGTSAGFLFAAAPSADRSNLTVIYTGSIGPGSGSVSSMAFASDGGTLAAAGGDSVSLWDVGTKATTDTWSDPAGGWVSSVAFSPHGDTLAAAAGDSVSLWDVGTKATTDTWSDPAGGWVSSVAFSPHGDTLAAAVGDSVYLWNVGTNTTTDTWSDPAGEWVSSVAFSPRRGLLAIGAADSLYLWDVSTNTTTHAWSGPAGEWVSSVAFSPRRGLLAIGAGDSVYLWDVATRRIASKLGRADGGPVSSVAFNPRGTILAAAYGDGSAYRWDIGRTRS
jgi:hypothetical protein